jgi:thiol-disulfide isomerase/thioredoxin
MPAIYKNWILTHLLIFAFSFFAIAQDSTKNKFVVRAKYRITSETIVTDSAGQILPYAIWTALKATGEYNIKPTDINNENTSFILYKLSEKDKQRNLVNADKMPKPAESKFFKTGESFSKIKTTDIHGNKINTKNLKGKIIVVNYWFTTCMPCITEIPELNKIADKYKDDSSVVFISIALDDADTIEQFLKLQPFKYAIIDNGRFLASDNNISSYPTNVVVDQNGKVYFHASGLAPNTPKWINRSIEELKTDATTKLDN